MSATVFKDSPFGGRTYARLHGVHPMDGTAKRPLTPAMRRLVRMIADYTRQRGYSPSMPELAAALGVDRTRTQYLARAAVERGALAHEPGRQRSWRVIDLAAATEPETKNGPEGRNLRAAKSTRHKEEKRADERNVSA